MKFGVADNKDFEANGADGIIGLAHMLICIMIHHFHLFIFKEFKNYRFFIFFFSI